MIVNQIFTHKASSAEGGVQLTAPTVAPEIQQVYDYNISVSRSITLAEQIVRFRTSQGCLTTNAPF